MPKFELNLDDYPIVRLNVSRVDPNPIEVDHFFDELNLELSKHKGPYVTITDARHVQFMCSNIRVQVGNRANKVGHRYTDRFKASIFVVETATSEVMVETMDLLLKYNQPQYVVKSLEEAEALAIEILSKTEGLAYNKKTA